MTMRVSHAKAKWTTEQRLGRHAEMGGNASHQLLGSMAEGRKTKARRAGWNARPVLLSCHGLLREEAFGLIPDESSQASPRA